MKKELLLTILNICLSFSVNAQADKFAVCDTITDIWGKQIIGKTIFKAATNEVNHEKTCLYFLKGNNEDSLIVVSDLSSSDFSLGGPYEQTRDSVLRQKFSTYKDVINITQDRMDLPETEYGPPYLFSVVIGNDTIEYQSDLKKQNYYGFAEAFINDSRFSFAGCQVGKHIKETLFGTHIADKTIKKIKNIEVWPSHYIHIHLQNVEHNIDEDWFLSIDIDEGYIKRLFVYSNGYY